MPRPARNQNRTHAAVQHALSVAAPAERVTALRREQDRLLKRIQSKKKELTGAVNKAQRAEDKMRQRVGPLFASVGALQSEVHALFAALLAPGAVPKRKRGQVERLYVSLQEIGFIDRRDPEPAGDAAFDPELWPEDDTAPRHGQTEPALHASAHKPQTESLRAVFRRLAIALHPDRARLESERERLTHIMKEVTRAYEAGDLARLLELERTWESQKPCSEALDHDAELVRALERTVRELKDQLRAIQSELMGVRRSDAFQAAREVETWSKRGIDPLDDVVGEAEAHLRDLQEIRDFVAAFSAGKLAWDDFTAGPPCVWRSIEDELLTLDPDALEMLIDASTPRAPAPRRKRGNKRA